ncbi:MAG: phosphoribosylanthranilate isomerase [Aristaeellaceae bacterium]
MTRIKICGLSRPCDVAYVNEARPDWCGFIIGYPRSHRSVTPAEALALRRLLDPGIIPVGVTVDQPVEAVAALLRSGGMDIAQLHGGEDEGYLAALRTLAPGYPLWKAFTLHTPDDLSAALASSADMILLDSGKGTGQTFDWSLLREVQRPFLLAGGLTPENIPRARRELHPYGIDLSSGVETDRRKDRDKILAAVAAARKD